ncbi:MAG: [FeFe] hydrogenase H-cluster radical SAM maturase HydE [Clostridioides sp.]|jgi:biotin synthase|nr:[FeFe] hydrogenase H-cluster radical SAM maturase HydE [Clostridioides sp.]
MNKETRSLKEKIDKLYETSNLDYDEILFVVQNIFKTEYNDGENLFDYICSKANEVRFRNYGNKVFLRGLIEVTNICKNDCYYCGIRCSNPNVDRYRLTREDILECCAEGYEIGYRTFVMQGGEDPYYDDEWMFEVIKEIRDTYPDCAITLSLGEKSYETYKKYYEAGGDRFLLRHESITEEHYQKLHPETMKLSNRLRCLKDLKDLGFQVGAGFMVGSPYQTDENLARDLAFVKEFQPHMVGIGPFIPHEDTKFKDFPHGDLNLTVLMYAMTRLLLPNCLLPATTAVASIDPNGRAKSLLAGCNVIMPNLSPRRFRKSYSLYNGKLSTGKEAAEYNDELEADLAKIGLQVEYIRGDNIQWRRK